MVRNMSPKDKRNFFDFDIVNYPFLDGDVPRITSFDVKLSKRIRFARASITILILMDNNVIDFK